MSNNAKNGSLRKLIGSNEALVVLILFLTFNFIVTPNFVSIGTLNNVIIQMTPALLTGLGMTWVIASGGIDISVGAVMALASIVSAKAMVPTAAALNEQVGGWGWCLPAIPAMLVGIIAGMISGLLVGLIIAKFRIQPIIVSLTFMISIRGIAQIMNDSMLLEFKDESYTFIGKSRLFGVVPIQLLIMVIAVIIIWYVSNKMAFGRYVQSVGDNFKASFLTGISTSTVIVIIYVTSAFLASIAGIVKTAELAAADANGIGKLIELDAIAAVAIGGTPMTGGKPRVIGTVFGVIIIALVDISVNMNNIPYAYAQVIKAAIIIVALWSQSLIKKGRA